ncbi:MAG: Rpn family recombination-promoting nuclease/putative transposase [Hydrococcus sp. Prado102]|nr:Rpn family recombination-promoting nuclease/putative transposase [Hydrococcus sp. Prado102]
MKTDSIFYRLFRELPASFFELIGRPSEEAIAYRFDSFEIKQTAFRTDGLFIPIEENRPLYFVEIQFRYDAKVYSGLFSEIFLYLNQNNSSQDWQAIVIYQTRRFEPRNLSPYQELLNSSKVTRIYLDELSFDENASLNLRLIEFLISEQELAVEKGKQLLAEVRQIETAERIAILELIETIISYKFSNLSLRELIEMFSLDEFKQSRLYQDIKKEIGEEGKLEIIPALVERGFTVEEIAEIIKLDVEKVRQAVNDLTKN